MSNYEKIMPNQRTKANPRTKEIAEWIVSCAKRNCEMWGEEYEDDKDALFKAHESTWLEDEEDMIHELGYSEKEIIKAWELVYQMAKSEIPKLVKEKLKKQGR